MDSWDSGFALLLVTTPLFQIVNGCTGDCMCVHVNFTQQWHDKATETTAIVVLQMTINCHSRSRIGAWLHSSFTIEKLSRHPNSRPYDPIWLDEPMKSDRCVDWLETNPVRIPFCSILLAFEGSWHSMTCESYRMAGKATLKDAERVVWHTAFVSCVLRFSLLLWHCLEKPHACCLEGSAGVNNMHLCRYVCYRVMCCATAYLWLASRARRRETSAVSWCPSSGQISHERREQSSLVVRPALPFHVGCRFSASHMFMTVFSMVVVFS